MNSGTPDPGFWSMITIVLVAAMRNGGPSLSWTVCAILLFCVIAGLFSK